METSQPSQALSVLSSLHKEILDLREAKSTIDKQGKEVAAKIDEAEAKLMQHLKDMQLDGFKSPHGAVSLVKKFSVRLPQGSDEWEKFYAYLKTKGHYDGMITVSSQRLNAYYREELEQARVRGDIDFAIPGLAEPSVHETLSFRKG